MTTGKQWDVVIEEMQNGTAVELGDRSTRLHHRDEKMDVQSARPTEIIIDKSGRML